MDTDPVVLGGKFCQMERDISVGTTEKTGPVFKGVPKYSGRTETKRSVPSDSYPNFPEFGAEWKSPFFLNVFHYKMALKITTQTRKKSYHCQRRGLDS